ncbi:MAG: response regulator, partial [Planctomycetes bacterium]|nr:response regulator [Planctomycetota bacterium]
VLYIDDDPRTRTVVGDMLESLGQEVDLAEGGVRGLELLETNEYDLVITDLGMPDMDGSVVTAKIKATQPDLPVAMLTGWASPAMRQTPRSVEAPDHVLSKPPSLAQLRELLQQVPPRME